MPITRVQSAPPAPASVVPMAALWKSAQRGAAPPPKPVYSLPTAPKEQDTDISHYTTLIYGREKIGKTTLMSSFPDALFLSTEPGTKGLKVFEFNAENGGITSWDVFRAAVDLLEKDRTRFKTIVIDTADRAYDMCLDWVCDTMKIEYPGHDSNGTEDFGKSWRAVKMEFLECIHRIAKTGRGICFTSHAKETEFKTKSGEKYTRIFPSMSSQARTVIEAIVDMFFYAEYVRDPSGETKRILICQGDDTIWAGARATVGGVFPQFLPMKAKDGYVVIRDAFMGKLVGIDPATLVPARTTTETAKKLIVKAKTKAAIAAQ